MKPNNIINKLEEKIKVGEGYSPILFAGVNLELLNSQVKNIAYELMNNFGVPKVNLFVLEDNNESIKIDQLKKFLEISNTTTSYKFQIFLIENISRMTVQSANSCLKFFEEPGVKNIIFLTNSGEAGILDTILSRVQFVDLRGQDLEKKDEFFYSLIDSSLKGSTEIVSYFFRNKLEKEDYLKFLFTIVLYAKQNLVFLSYLEEIESDINSISNNNVNPRGIVDKWILRLNN